VVYKLNNQEISRGTPSLRICRYQLLTAPFGGTVPEGMTFLSRLSSAKEVDPSDIEVTHKS
jgi:hypothetical protein